MSDNLQSKIQAEVGKAVSAAITKAVQEHYKFTTAETKIVRAKKIAKGATHIEMFPVRIEHTGTEYGRDATVSVDGCNRKFKIEQNGDRPQHKRSWQTKLPFEPQWHVYVCDKESMKKIESTENFEQAVQNCVVALIGHVYYDGAV